MQIELQRSTAPQRVFDQIEHEQVPALQRLLLVIIGFTGINALAAIGAGIIITRPLVLDLFLIPSSLLLLIGPVVGLLLLRRGRFRAAVTTTVYSFIIAHSVFLLTVGVNNSFGLLFYLIPLTLAGVLARRRELWGTTMLVVVIIALMSRWWPQSRFTALAEMNALSIGIPTVAQSSQVAIAFTLVVLALAALFDQFSGSLRTITLRALAREQELEQLRATLESEVGMRTTDLQTALHDIEQRAAEQNTLLMTLQTQREVIRDLGVPVLPVSTSTLVIPLVGTLDEQRLNDLRDNALQAIERNNARRLILDITGVPMVDDHIARGLLSVVQAGRLLGTAIVLVGIRPEVAQTIVGSEFALTDVHTFADLRSALAAEVVL